MVNIAGLFLVALIFSAFWTNVPLLIFGYLLIAILTVNLHNYDCQVIMSLAVGVCQDYTDVIDDVAQNMAVLAAVFVLFHTGTAVIRKFLKRL